MPKITEEHAEDRRLQILWGAMACFSEKGFHKCTMQDICKASGLSTGAVYSYFDSKDAIIQALCEHHQTENDNRFATVASQEDPQAAFNVLIDQFFDLFKDPEYKKLKRADIMMFAEGLVNEEVGQTAKRSFTLISQQLTNIVAKAQKAGAVNNHVNPETVAAAMIALFQGLDILLQFDQQVDIDEYKEVVRSMFFNRFWKSA